MTGAVERVSGAPDALDRARNALRRRYHNHQIDSTDVDAELKAGGANYRAQLAIFQTVLHFQTNVAIKRGVVRLDLVGQLRQEFFQPQSDLLRSGANVGKNENRLLAVN